MNLHCDTCRRSVLVEASMEDGQQVWRCTVCRSSLEMLQSIDSLDGDSLELAIDLPGRERKAPPRPKPAPQPAPAAKPAPSVPTARATPVAPSSATPLPKGEGPSKPLGRIALKRVSATDLLAERSDVLQGQIEDLSPAPGAELVVLAEDTPHFRQVTFDALITGGLAQEVVACANGADFVSAVTQRFSKGQDIGFVVLDVEMPLLNGFSAAVALRAIERGFKRPAPTPILFYTMKAHDEAMRRMLDYASPAAYLGKSADTTPDQLGGLLRGALKQLLSRP